MPTPQPDDDHHNHAGNVTFGHRLLQRQVRKYLGLGKPLPEEWVRLLQAVEEAYGQFDTDRRLVERTMELSSNELIEANSLLRLKHERDQALLERLRLVARALHEKDGAASDDGSSDLLNLSNLLHEQVQLRATAEEKIREQAALLDTASEAIYVCSLEGVVLYWNHGAEQLYGWSQAEALNQQVASLFPLDWDAADAARQALFHEGSWAGERRHPTKAGLAVIVDSRMTLVRDASGQPRSVFVINSDVTEKKELENQFLRGQRMESLGALASGIAHELNNVLTPIVLGAQMLRTAMPSEEARQMLADIETSAHRGADIVKKVLTFARGVEGERLALHPRDLLREIETIISSTFPKNILIQTRVEPDLWPIIGDATQLHQALINLCINARDAMPEGGILQLWAERDLPGGSPRAAPGRVQIWHATDPRPGPHVSLGVADSGTGIAPEILEKVFEPFFTTKAVGKGTGLGLSTVLGIVRSHGGSLRVASEVGQGSSFELCFPAAPDANVSAKPAVDLNLLRGQGQLIMLVDDEKAVRDVATKILTRFGYEVISAASGDEAVHAFSRQHAAIEAVITDMAMPGMDGPALVKILRQIDPSVRVVGTSGHTDNAKDNSLSPWSLPVFLAKPFTAERLLAVMSEVLRMPRPPG